MAEHRTVNPWVVGSSPTLGAMTNYIPEPNDYCVDCKINTFIIGEYYMVHHSVWEDSGLGLYDGMLCISCLEKRIGRQLTSEDFSNFPINKDPIYRSETLLSRMSK